MTGLALVLAFILLALAFPVLLYIYTQQEISNLNVMDRSEAERVARDRGGRPGRDGEQRDDRDDTDDEWGAESRRESRSRRR